MRFDKTVRVEASPAEIWGLLDDIEAVALCIPGISDYKETGPNEFTAMLSQRVGPVTARFRLRTTLKDLVRHESVTAVVEGADNALASSVSSEQVFTFSAADGGAATEILITADVGMVGRVATFAQRIIATKAEQVIIGALTNVSRLLEERRAGNS
ncbi:MAG: SRPBCC domain-containing protein [bacterium]|nr:SRPBCC domain-containing protein [bacterium]MDE0288264.1 SRPBCC domain-containing protein [bacterium]MDE0439271.1 SRPBCC domain-containing protein [bacterium]